MGVRERRNINCASFIFALFVLTKEIYINLSLLNILKQNKYHN